MTRALLLAAVVVGLVAPMASAAAPAPAPSAVPTFDTLRLYSEAEFAQTIKVYSDAIARNANNADAHRWLGVAYLHAFTMYRFGLAPYASGFGGRAVESLERAAELRAEPAVLLALAEAYAAVGRRDAFGTMMVRLADLAEPVAPR